MPPYKETCKSMLEWSKKSNWHSYDPFDGGLSPISKALPERGRWIFQHLIRLSPVNLRPLLGIKKQVNAKGLAHSMQGCLRLHGMTNEPAILRTASQLADRLLRLTVWKGDRCSWNYPFPYITKGLTCRKGTNIVNTAFVGLALLDAYKELREKKYLETAFGAARFIVHDIGYCDYKGGRICFYYAPQAKDTLSIHNANMVAANLLYRVGLVCENDVYKKLARSAVNYTLDYQLPNGLWHYSERPGLKWIDCFHTGFVLDTLMLLADSEGHELYYSAINRGMKGFKMFFNKDGRITHFLNKPYPEDIRSYAQFIQTGALFSKYNPEWLQLATTAANYAIKTMFSHNGVCYYKRYRYMTIKTPFIRWSLGPMIIALANLIEKTGVKYG